MALWLWRFWTYSFLGYLLERGFAAATRSPHQVRKCFLLLPLCPVYGLGVAAVLAWPGALEAGFFPLALWGGAAATAVEYAVHWAYDRLLGVQFWDYSRLPGQLHGRVCVPFSLVWGGLIGALLPAVDGALAPALAAIPPGAAYAMALVFTADAVCSVQILRRTADPEQLRLAP